MKRNPAKVSVIVATYNRPNVLRAALKSVLGQTYGNVEIIVVGDCCDERTAEVIGKLNDDRIIYYNLSDRFGEQSGPNSLGMLKATGDYLAYLNHDDIWLPDHLETALQTIGEDKNRLYFAKTAFYKRSESVKGMIRPSFNYFNPEYPQLLSCFHVFCNWEPCSSWVMHRSLANKIGYWERAVDLVIPPIQEWMKRAGRRNAVLTYGILPTVLKITPYRQKGSYQLESDEHNYVETHWLNLSAKQIREIVKNDSLTAETDELAQKPFETPAFSFRYVWQKVALSIYKISGLDPRYIRLRITSEKGTRLRALSLKRTGKALPVPMTIRELIKRYS